MKKMLSWLLRITAAAILLQTLYFKFTAHPESVAIFSKLGIEPWGRIGTGIAELIAGILLLIPQTVVIGALMALGIMAGAIVSHIAIIGIESMGDGGQLFALAIVVSICCFVIVWLHQSAFISLYKKIIRA